MEFFLLRSDSALNKVWAMWSIAELRVQVGDTVRPETEEVSMLLVPPCATNMNVSLRA